MKNTYSIFHDVQKRTTAYVSSCSKNRQNWCTTSTQKKKERRKFSPDFSFFSPTDTHFPFLNPLSRFSDLAASRLAKVGGREKRRRREEKRDETATLSFLLKQTRRGGEGRKEGRRRAGGLDFPLLLLLFSLLGGLENRRRPWSERRPLPSPLSPF